MLLIIDFTDLELCTAACLNIKDYNSTILGSNDNKTVVSRYRQLGLERSSRTLVILILEGRLDHWAPGSHVPHLDQVILARRNNIAFVRGEPRASYFVTMRIG